MSRKTVVKRTYLYRILFPLCVLIFSMNSAAVLANCSEAQQDKAAKYTQDAMSAADEIDRVIMLKRSLKVCPEYTTWLALGKLEFALANPIDAVSALENARDFYAADENNTYSRDQVVRRSIASSWLAETYLRDNDLALATVTTQEATAGYESSSQPVPSRLIELQAEIDDALVNADAAVLIRSLTVQHDRASRGIGVRPKIRTQETPTDTKIDTAQLLAEYNGDATADTDADAATETETAAETTAVESSSDTLPATAPTESRLNIPVLFEFDSDQLSTASMKTVAQLGAAIQALNLLEKDSLLIVGHTDAQGSAAYNLALSERRAESVLRQIKQLVDIKAVVMASGKGEAELRYQGSSDDDHRRNRRVEMVIRR